MAYADEYDTALQGKPMKYSHAAFQSQIAAQPDDKTTRGVYADWLEERNLADPDTLHTLRHGDYPVWVHEHEGQVKAGRKWTLDDIKKHVTDSGHHFFSPSTRRFFQSRTSPNVHNGPGGTFFVDSTSQFGDDREYRVHEFIPYYGDGTPRDTPFGDSSDPFDNARDAHTLARQLAHTVPAKS